MKKLKIFISSVQSEFAEEREFLFDYLTSDALLGLFFEPFIFEKLPATTHSVASVYLNEVEHSDIYLGILGKEYGYEDAEGFSPTQREFEHARKHHKTMLIFLSNHSASERHPKELQLIKKAEQLVVRKIFSSQIELKTGVYISLVRYLEEKELIRTVPFDASLNSSANLNDLDFEKIQEFVRISKTKRGFPISEEASPETILTHLNLLVNGKLANAAILLFGKQPQRFFLSSEVKCAHFHGFEITKPIPSYQVYKGDVFQLVNQAVDFVLSKIDVSVGNRELSSQVPVDYELPRAAVSEAIVNAVAHRDYTGNGSVQVMLFKDRLEIWNPGKLPYELTTAKLREPHPSIPANPLLAEPLYLAGYIERMGTGTGDIIRLCAEAGLKPPVFVQEEIFKIIIWRKESAKQVLKKGIDDITPHDTPHDTDHDTDHDKAGISELVNRLIINLSGEMSRSELQEILEIKHQPHFRESYLKPALEMGIIEMTIPEKSKSKKQKYRLTQRGLKIKEKLLESK